MAVVRKVLPAIAWHRPMIHMAVIEAIAVDDIDMAQVPIDPTEEAPEAH